MRLAALLSLSLLWAAVEAPTASAQDPYGCLGELQEAELEARLALVDRRLQAGKRGARAWWYGWQAIFGGVFGYQLGSIFLADTQSKRWASSIGTAGAFLALAQMWLLPQPAAYAPQRYRRMPTETRAQREAKLAYGLDRLETSASREVLGRGPMAHAVPIVWSAVWATTLSLKFDDPPRVAQLVVGGFLITQARIWTTPQRAIRDWNEVRWTVCEHRFVDRGGDEGADESEPAPPTTTAAAPRGPQVQVAPFFGGGQVVVTF